MPGVFVVRKRATLGTIIEQLLLLFGASEAEEYSDGLVYLPLT